MPNSASILDRLKLQHQVLVETATSLTLGVQLPLLSDLNIFSLFFSTSFGAKRASFHQTHKILLEAAEDHPIFEIYR